MEDIREYCLYCGNKFTAQDGRMKLRGFAQWIHMDSCWDLMSEEIQFNVHWREHNGSLVWDRQDLMPKLPVKKKEIASESKKWHWIAVGFLILWSVLWLTIGPK